MIRYSNLYTAIDDIRRHRKKKKYLVRVFSLFRTFISKNNVNILPDYGCVLNFYNPILHTLGTQWNNQLIERDFFTIK